MTTKKRVNKNLHHLTINEKSLEFYREIIKYLTSLSGFQYILVTEHIGEDKGKHYHIFVQYLYSTSLSYKKLNGAHDEYCYSSAQQNIQYLKCEDDKHKKQNITYKLIYEEGTPKLKGGYTVKDLLNANSQEIPAIYYNIQKSIRNDHQTFTKKTIRKEIKVYYIQGPPDIGKTNAALDMLSDDDEFDMVKFDGQFWHGISKKSKIAIYDDWRDSHMKPSEFINFIDYNKHLLNVKNGTRINNYELIIITSVLKLSEIYYNSSEPRKQWEKRIIINFT